MRVHRLPALTVLVVLATCSARATFPDSSATVHEGFEEIEGFRGRKIVATTAAVGLLAGSIFDSYFAWWKESTNQFTIRSEGWFGPSTHLGIDKAGHFYTSYFYFHTFRNLLLWGGYPERSAFWSAAGASAFFAIGIEVGDGFSDYAFDLHDLVFNIGGLAYAMMQVEYPVLRSFNFKFGYYPREGYTFPPRFTEHYDAHTYWLSTNVHDLLSDELAFLWPEFLTVGIGYSVDAHASKRELAFGLDVNLEAFPIHNKDLVLLQKTINMFHLPAPAVKLTESTPPRYYLFHRN